MLVNPDSIPDAWRVAMEMAANPNKVTAALPEDTLVMYSGQKLRLLFDQIADVAGLADPGHLDNVVTDFPGQVFDLCLLFWIKH